MMSLTFGLFTQVSGSGPLGPLVFFLFVCFFLEKIECVFIREGELQIRGDIEDNSKIIFLISQ